MLNTVGDTISSDATTARNCDNLDIFEQCYVTYHSIGNLTQNTMKQTTLNTNHV